MSPRADTIVKQLPRPLQVKVRPGPWKAPLLPRLPATAVRLTLPLTVCESPPGYSRGPSADKAAFPSRECLPRWPPSPPAEHRGHAACSTASLGRGACRPGSPQSPVGPVHMPVEAAGGPQPVGASLQSLPPSPRGISASGSVSHVLGGRRPCGGNSGGHCPRLSTFQPSRPAAGDRDRLPRQDVSSGPDTPREEWVALLRSSGVGAAVVQG